MNFSVFRLGLLIIFGMNYVTIAEQLKEVKAEIAIRITNVEMGEKSFLITVEVFNNAAKPLLFWDLDTEPGREIASFVFRDESGALLRVNRTTNMKDFSGPFVVGLIDAKKSKVWKFDLKDGTWHIPTYIGDGSAKHLSVELNSPRVATTDKAFAWRGNLTSKEFIMDKPMLFAWPYFAAPFLPSLDK